MITYHGAWLIRKVERADGSDKSLMVWSCSVGTKECFYQGDSEYPVTIGVLALGTVKVPINYAGVCTVH